MRQSGSSEPPVTPSARVDDAQVPTPRVPSEVAALCAHLSAHGLDALLHGDGVLDAIRPRALAARPDAPSPLPAIACAATPARVAAALPRAVVTAEGGARLMQASEAGPVDVLCLGAAALDQTLPRFALGPLAFAYHPAKACWVDPADQLAPFLAGRLALARRAPDPFREAPRRYWIAARLIAEFALAPDEAVMASARGAFGEVVERLPQGAPARRALTRVLMSADPEPALAFLDHAGVTAQVAPGAQPVHAARIARLAPLIALRWAAWLRGAATARAMVTFRMPHDLARRIERLQASHPLERAAEGGRETSLRRLSSRLSPGEIDALLAWRRVELEDAADRAQAAAAAKQLDAFEARLAREREKAAEGARVRTLALDGAAVMARLGAGPGRHVGLALAHLARFVGEDPARNDAERLGSELDAWASANPELLPRAGAPQDPSIG